MPVKVLNTPMGHSAPPEGPHTITIHIPGWDNVMNFREGDKDIMAEVTSIYPRFFPWNESKKVSESLQLYTPFTVYSTSAGTGSRLCVCKYFDFG